MPIASRGARGTLLPLSTERLPLRPLVMAGSAVFGLLIWLSPERAQASPVLEASIVWHGECDQRHALNAEIRARGVALEERAPEVSPLELAVSVARDEAGFSADLVLVAHEGREELRVEIGRAHV